MSDHDQADDDANTTCATTMQSSSHQPLPFFRNVKRSDLTWNNMGNTHKDF